LRFMDPPLACGDPACTFTYSNGAYTTGGLNSVLDHSLKQSCTSTWAYGKQGDRCPDGSAFPAADGLVVAFNGESAGGPTRNGDNICVGGTINLRPTASSYPMTNASACGAGYTSYDEHPGYDYRAEKLTPVRAVAKGIIIDNGGQMCVLNGFTNCADFGFIGIDHGNGYISQYGHLDPASLAVSAGQAVAEGDLIGLSGEKGVEGHPHLHFEVLKLVPGRPNN